MAILTCGNNETVIFLAKLTTTSTLPLFVKLIFDITGGNEIKLSIAYNIEEDWDFFIVQFFDESTNEWISIAGDKTVENGYGFNDWLPGLTGTSPGFPSPDELVYTVPPQFSGLSKVKIALRYLADDMYEVYQGVDLHGMTVNNVPMVNANDINSWEPMVDNVDEWSVIMVAFNTGGSDEVRADRWLCLLTTKPLLSLVWTFLLTRVSLD
jgi:hypothetical protein